MTRRTKMVEKKRGEGVQHEQQPYQHQPADSETARWTLWGRSVLPTTLEGRVAVFFGVLWPIPFLGVAMFGALIFLVLAIRKGDRGLLLVLPLLASIVVAMFAVVVVFQIPGA